MATASHTHVPPQHLASAFPHRFSSGEVCAVLDVDGYIYTEESGRQPALSGAPRSLRSPRWDAAVMFRAGSADTRCGDSRTVRDHTTSVRSCALCHAERSEASWRTGCETFGGVDPEPGQGLRVTSISVEADLGSGAYPLSLGWRTASYTVAVIFRWDFGTLARHDVSIAMQTAAMV
jgi:hypothetical protein